MKNSIHHDGPIGEFEPHGSAARPKPKKKGWTKGRIAAAGAGLLVFGIVIGSCGGEEPTAQPEPEQTTSAPEPTREPSPEPDPEPTEEVKEEVAEEIEDVPVEEGAGEQLLVAFLRSEYPNSSLFPMMSDEQIIESARTICTRYDVAEPGTNVALQISLEHIGGNGFVPGYLSGYGTDDADLGSLIGAGVVALCPQHEDRMFAEADALS